MINTNKITLLLSALKRCEFELGEILKASTNHNVQYLRALNAEYDADTNSLVPTLTDRDFNPTLMPWPSCLNTIWSNKTEPNRAPNSLPRYSGHIVAPESHAVSVFELVNEINSLKGRIASEAKSIHEEYDQGEKSRNTRITTTLQELEIFDETENYQATVRKVLCTDPNIPIDAITINWLKNPSSTDFKGDLTKANATFSSETHGNILDALAAYERAHPGTTFLRRYYSPPTIMGKIKAGGEWDPKPYAISTPIIVTNPNEQAKFKTVLCRLEVQMLNGNIRSTLALKKAKEGKGRGADLHPILSLPNWYAVEPPK